MSGRLEVKTYRCKRCSWESEPKTVFSFESPVFTCDLCGAKCSPAGEKNKNETKDIAVEDETVVVLNSDDEEIDEDWDKNVRNGFDLSDKKNQDEKSKQSQDDSKVSSFQDSFASSVKSFQERQREQAEQLRRMWNLDGSAKRPEPAKQTPFVIKVERTPYVPVVPPRPDGVVLPNPVDLTQMCDPPKPLTIPGENMSTDLSPEDLSINCDPPNPPPKPGTDGETVQSPADFRAAWNTKPSSQATSGLTVPSLSTGPSPAEFRAAWTAKAGQQPLNVQPKTGGQSGPVRTGGQYDKNVVTDEEEAMKRKREAAKFREEWNRKNGLVGVNTVQNALQVQSELQVQVYQCEHCGWESEPKTVFATTDNSYSTCDLCGFRSVKKPQNDLSKHNYNIRMEEHQKMLLQRHTELASTDLIQSRMAWQERKTKNQRKSFPKVRNVGGGSGGLDFKKDNTPAGLLKSLYGNANAVHAPVATSFYVNDLLRQDNTEVVIDIDEQDENIEEEEKEPEEEKTEEPPADNDIMKRPPKNWESAEVAGFPQGWLWKRTNAWSRRIKVMSPQGKVFNWRNAAVAHMEEQYPYVYTRVQIDRAKNWEDKDWRDKHDKQPVECS